MFITTAPAKLVILRRDLGPYKFIKPSATIVSLPAGVNFNVMVVPLTVSLILNPNKLIIICFSKVTASVVVGANVVVELMWWVLLKMMDLVLDHYSYREAADSTTRRY